MLANFITILRLALLPLMIYLLSRNSFISSALALGFFFLVLLSDLLDGYIARRRHEASRLGSFLDPISDLIIVYSLLIFFTLKNNLLLIPLAVFLVRDISITFHRFLAAKHDLEIGQDPYQKRKNLLQYILVLLLLLENLLQHSTISDSFYMMITQSLVFFFLFAAVIYSLASAAYHLVKVMKSVRKKIKLGREIKPEQLIILANKKSRGYRDAYRRKLLQKFAKKRKAQLVFLSAEKKEMFSGIGSQIKKIKHLVIAGGDGSFESALNHKIFNQKSLGFFPLGAGNAFYSYFYKGKRFEYLRSRFPFQEAELDVLELEWEKGSRQTLFAGLGIDSEVLRLTKARTQYGFLNYLGGCWRGLLRGKADYDLMVKIDRKEYRWENCMNLNFGKIPYYGYGLRAFPSKIPPADGLVYGLASVNPHSLFWNKPVRLWGLLLTTLGIDRAPSLEFKGQDIYIKSEVPFPLEAGGEFLGYSGWVRIKVKRKQKVLII